MATSDGSTSSSESFPAEPLQPRSFHFPKREFGEMTVVKRSFNPGWFDRYKWLHYDEAKDAAFCHVGRCAADQKRLKASHKDAAFIYKGFQNWKDGTVSLSRHESSDCNKESVSQRYEVGRAEPEFSSSPEALYKTMYFEALDLVVNCIKARFHQPGYVMYKNLEELLIHAVNRKEFEEKFKLITDFYGSDFNSYRLRGQLEVLSAYFKDKSSSVSFRDILEYLKSLSTALKVHYSEVVTLVKLILVLLAINATSERTFSAIRRVKSYLRATMTQEG